MEMTQAKDQRAEALELILARLLRFGSMGAAALLAAGIFLGVTGLAPLLGPDLVTVGLLVLVSTPVVRVVVALAVFVREKDMAFAAFSLVVLASLAVGILIGQTH